MKNMLLIVNPVSGKMKAKTTLFSVVEALQKGGYVVTVRLTDGRGDATKYAAKAAEEGYDAVVAFGGDGTLNETICGLMQNEKTIPLGYIPAGSTNDFAQSMKLLSTPSKAASVIAEGEAHRIDIGRFNKERYFTYVAGFGAFTQTSYNVPQEVKNYLGHFAYVLEGVKELGSIRSYKATIELDDRTLQGDYIFFSVTNSKSVAGIVKLKDELVDLRDGVFEVALVKMPRNIIELNKIATAITTSNFENGGIEFYKSSKVKVISEEELNWTLDGEFASSQGEVVIENVNKAIKFLR